MTGLTRREAMQGVAALAATRLDAEDYDLANVDEWQPLGIGSWKVDAIGTDDARGRFETPHTGADVELGAEAPSQVNVWYSDRAGVTIGIERERDTDDVYLGARTVTDPDTARQVAAAIYQAAEELERRREAEANR